MKFYESETVELKSVFVEEIKKEVVAFANSNEGKRYIVTAIRNMIKETDGDNFETVRSLNQKLTFECAVGEFKKRNIEFTQVQMQTLKILNTEGLYTNLGLLLSDQNFQTTKVAIFSDIDQSVFQDRREFKGAIFKQLNDVYEYVDFRNQTRATFNKLLRIDTRDYPETAVREALLNSLVHRDYGIRASTQISIYSDRMEFLSIGGLLPGITLDDVMAGVSICRNVNLANIFYRLKLIEVYGTGIKKIFDSYKKYEIQPKLEVTDNTFKVILPNVNNQAVVLEEPVIEYNIDYKNRTESSLHENNFIDVFYSDDKRVLKFLEQKHRITRADVETLLGVSTATAYRVLMRLIDEGFIVKMGQGRKTIYVQNQTRCH